MTGEQKMMFYIDTQAEGYDVIARTEGVEGPMRSQRAQALAQTMAELTTQDPRVVPHADALGEFASLRVGVHGSTAEAHRTHQKNIAEVYEATLLSTREVI
jgi:hypothetical protein